MNNLEETASFQSFEKSPYFSVKYKKYFAIYDQLFSSFRNKKITFVEIGVLQGGSLFMWRDFFGPEARIIGIDLNPDAKHWEQYGFEIFIGDQSQPNFWQDFAKTVTNIDILLDDGGHTNLQQLVTLFEVSKFVNPQGLIVIEDTHASYQKEFGNPGRFSFINITKRFIDNLNLYFENPGERKVDLEGIHSIEYFESIVAFKFSSSAQDMNSIVNNSGTHMNHVDFRYANQNRMIRVLQKIEGVLSLNYSKIGRTKSYLRFLNVLLENEILKNFFKVLLSPIHKLIQFLIGISLNYETFKFISKQKI
jgi:hypothetical protein